MLTEIRLSCKFLCLSDKHPESFEDSTKLCSDTRHVFFADQDRFLYKDLNLYARLIDFEKYLNINNIN